MSGDALDQEVQQYLDGRRRRTVIAWVASAVAVAAALTLGYAVYVVNDDGDSNDRQQVAKVEAAQKTADKANRTADRIAAEYNTLYRSFEKCLDRPDSKRCEEPPTPTPEQVAKGTAVPRTIVRVETLSPAAIDSAFRRYCAENGRCDGKSPTRAQLQAAVSTYCNARGECTGKDGESVKGDKGDKGDTTPPSDAQVLAGVSAYCEAHGGCKGDDGDTGPICPEGYHGEAVEVLTSLTTSEQIFACRANPA